jgi:hypothetical protein
MRKIMSLVGAILFGFGAAIATAEPVRLLCVGEFNFTDGEGQGFDGAYKWSFYVTLDEQAGTLVSAPMFPEPVPMSVTPQKYSARVSGEYCFKPFGPSDENHCGVGTRTLEIDRSKLSLVFSYTPNQHRQPLGALRQGTCRPSGTPGS